MGEAKRRKDIMTKRILDIWKKKKNKLIGAEDVRGYIKNHEPELHKYLECGFVKIPNSNNPAILLELNPWIGSLIYAQELIDTMNSPREEWVTIDWKSD